ncbi:hypothetical protein BU15DRAFT_85684 [Melanogaster broomeanus]|nr:hypothetical protein BU15DRAFT_85684 [Melanogaster broomeanus]
MPHARRSFTIAQLPCPYPGCEELLKNKSALTQHQRSVHQQSFRISRPDQPHRDHHPATNNPQAQCFVWDYHLLLDAGDFIDPTTPPPVPSERSNDDWTPYRNRLEFETAHFLFSQEEMSAKKINALLHLWGISLAVHDLYGMIDATPLGDVPWSSHSISYTGDRSGDIAPWMDIAYEVHFRDPQQLAQNILKNLDFKDEIDYTPYREWEERPDGTYNRRWRDLMSADWAWNQADIIAQDPQTHGSAFVPIILGSDKTMVSVATGQNDYYPLYLSIGNVRNNVCRAHRNAVVLVGFLAIAKTTKKYSNDARFRTFKKQLFHSSLSKILETLRPGMTIPEIIMCADGHYRKVVYRLGPYIADYEEQVVLAGIVRNWCGWYVLMYAHTYHFRCIGFPWDLDGEYGNRTRELREALIEEIDFGTLWDEWGIIGDIVLFTSHFPRSDIHALLAPDLLHQLIKGTFKDHLVDWVGYYLEETYGATRAKEILDDIDRRIAAAPSFSGLRRFAEGRGFSQWTGDDSKALMKVYINAIEGYVPEEMVCTFRAFLEFCFIARHDIVTDDTLEDLEDALKRFHECREIFISTNVRSNFALPWQHAMKHYPELICLFGAPNGLCSSITESKHIEAVKRPYRHSSKFNALKQVLLTNQRMDKLAASLVDFTARGMLKEPSALTHLRYFEKLNTIPDDTERNPHSSVDGLRTANNNIVIQQPGVEGLGEEPSEDEDVDESAADGERALCDIRLARTIRMCSKLVFGPSFFILLNHYEERHHARNIPDLAEELNIPELPTLIRCFLYDQLHADTHRSSADVPLQVMPVYRGRVDVFHSALATFFAPSDPSGTGGMHREHIQATPSWRRGAARYDTVLVDMDNSTNSINGMDIARVLCLFSFPFLSKMFPCALVHWYKHIGSQPDNTTGLWMVRPSFEDDGSRELSVIHLDTIFRAVHLLPIFGNSDSIHPAVNLHNSLDAFKGYYINKFADHHSFEILS